MAKRDSSRVVFSSGGHRSPEASGPRDLRKARDPAAKPRIQGDGRVRVRRETSGRRGKAVTTVAGVPVDDAALAALAGKLKKRCGVGGSVKDGTIELQGDHRDVVVELLRGDGFDVVLAGG